MDTLKFISIAVLAVLAAAAQTDKADGSDHALDFQGQIPEAARPYGILNSNKTRAMVLDETPRAVRIGLIPHGEMAG